MFEDYWEGERQEEYWGDDLYQLNQNEADDYRHELEDDAWEDPEEREFNDDDL